MKIKIAIFALFTLIFLSACDGGNPISVIRKKINIKGLFDRLKGKKTVSASDSANLFDNDNYDPSTIDSTELLKTIETIYASDSALAEKMNMIDTALLHTKNDSLLNDSNMVIKDTFTNDIKKMQATEVMALRYNLDQVKEKLKASKIDTTSKIRRQKDAKVWADVSKTEQRLYLYIEGACVDTFKVSTGSKGHETPLMDRRPSGPAFRKYTSKKYPGGNYNGLGNMPYVVFVQGGYAIHGTTLGNIPKLGKKASHGCVRVHPDKAKIFNELVSAAGIENCWVTIRE
jgi:lipoprotein-anchoring transpeptidase ErfK/SrfK